MQRVLFVSGRGYIMTIIEKDRRTKKLLKNYRMIRSACDLQQVQRAEDAAAYNESLLWFSRLMRGKDPDRITEEIAHTSQRTAWLLAGINHAVNRYRTEAAFSLPVWRRFDALYSLYISETPCSIPDLCHKWNCSKSTLYRDLQQAEESMAFFLFPED